MKHTLYERVMMAKNASIPITIYTDDYLRDWVFDSTNESTFRAHP